MATVPLATGDAGRRVLQGILHVILKRFAWTVLVIAGTAGWACRDTDPPPAMFTDLGTEDRPLMPPPSSLLVSGVKSGQAEWVAFRAPGTAAKKSEEKPEEADKSAGNAGAEVGGAEVKAAVETFIAEYNKLAKERKTDDLVEFHVESQRQGLRPMIELAYTVVDRFVQVREQLELKLPDAKERISMLFAAMGDPTSSGLSVTSLKVVSPTEVVGTLPPGQLVPACRFLLQDGDWYLEYPGLADPAQLMPLLEMGAKQIEALAQGLATGAVSADAVLAQLEMAAKAAAAMSGGQAPGAPPPGGDAEQPGGRDAPADEKPEEP